MGLFDFFKKKSSDEEKSTKDEDKIVIKVENTDDSAPGWEAIDAEFDRLYPDQPKPLHYGTVLKYMLGGPDPLDGISVYDAGDFWHFVSYGLSELYTKESEDPEYSGYGIELTFKLKKSKMAVVYYSMWQDIFFKQVKWFCQRNTFILNRQ